MHGVREIIQEATALPIEERTMVVDSLLRSLNAPTSEIDQTWFAVAQQRLDELRSGTVQGIPGNEVFARIRERFSH